VYKKYFSVGKNSRPAAILLYIRQVRGRRWIQIDGSLTDREKAIDEICVKTEITSIIESDL
jgi:hypothetical protein